MGGDISAEIGGLRSELRTEIAGVKAEVAGLKAEIAGVRAEVSDVKADVRGLRAEVRDYHHAVVGHGIANSEHDDRISTLERHAGLPPAA